MPRIRPARFVHVVYRTRRFEQMIQWYETVFDAKVRYQNPVLAFLTYDDEHHRVALANMAAIQPDGTEIDRRGVIGVDHVAYTYASVDDLFENYAQLKEKGILPYWCVHHGVTMSISSSSSLSSCSPSPSPKSTYPTPIRAAPTWISLSVTRLQCNSCSGLQPASKPHCKSLCRSYVNLCYTKAADDQPHPADPHRRRPRSRLCLRHTGTGR